MLARAQAAVRATREQALADAQAVAEDSKPIPARILAMARDAVLARLRELTQASGLQPALQFRDLDERSTGDLQRLLADLEDQFDDSAG